MKRGPIRRIKDKLAWLKVKGKLKQGARWLDMNAPKPTMDFWSGKKTKAGLAGTFIITIGTILSKLANLDLEADASYLEAFSAAVPVLKEGFIALGGYGLCMKLLKWWEART